jgi:small-conductance mechanosensitive channel
MNLNHPFAGGLAGETYGEGVRRRIRSIGIVWALVLVSLAMTYAVFLVSRSVSATLGVAALCGVACSMTDLRFDPVRGEARKQSDKLIWLILYVPALVLLCVVSAYTGLHARDGFDVFKAALLADLFGWVLGFTILVLRGADSRAHA